MTETRFARYCSYLSGSNPLVRIRDDFVANFHSNDDFVAFAGSAQDAPKLAALIIKVLSDLGEMDRLRFFFATKLAIMETFDATVCNAYLIAMSKCNTFSLSELESTVLFMQQRGWRCEDPLVRLSVAEMRFRCGKVDVDFWPECASIERTASNTERVTEALLSIFASYGVSSELCRLFLWLCEGDVDERILRLSFVLAVIRSLTIPSKLRSKVALEALRKGCTSSDKIVEAAVDYCSAVDVLPILRFVDKILPEWARATVNELLLSTEFDDAVDLIELCEPEATTIALWSSTLSSCGTERVDAFYFAIERRKDVKPVTSRSLNIVLWACALLCDETRLKQTRSAFEGLGVPVSDACVIPSPW